MNINKIALLACWMVAAITLADDHIIFNVHTAPMEIMGQKKDASDVKTHFWISENQVANLVGAQKLVVDVKKQTAYYVEDPKKSYIEMPMPVDFKNYLPEPMLAMMQQVKTKVSVTEEKETREILGVKCRTYTVIFESPMGKVHNKVFTSENVPFDYARFQKLFEETLNQMKYQMLDESALKEIRKMKGFMMGMEMNTEMMGTTISSTTMAVSIKKEKAPEGMYSVPEGYRKLDKLALPKGPQQ
jgi:hypothetical protein